MPHTPLFLQLVLILGVARLCATLMHYVGQPAVVGEMVAGILLGPIVFGALAPGMQAEVFEKSSLAPLGALSQLGLVLFMFIVGVELRTPTGVRRQLSAAGWVGIMSVLLPMALGLVVASLTYPSLAVPGVGFWPYGLFMASAMSITAFPIMARILKERGMTHSHIGRLSLTAAAIADVLAWVMLALVLALAGSRNDWGRFSVLVAGLVALVIVAFGGLRPLYAAILRRYAPQGRPGGAVLAGMMVGLFACAWVTMTLGVHAVFGSFLFGACLPRDDRLMQALIERVEYLAVAVLMPIFFALAGLSTTPNAFGSAGLAALALIMAAAVIGKVAGAAAGARIAGEPWRESLAVGSLMNARALMELIVIKVGLDMGVIGAELFTMLLVMAIVTTAMTGPMLTAILGFGRKAGAALAPGAPE